MTERTNKTLSAFTGRKITKNKNNKSKILIKRR